MLVVRGSKKLRDRVKGPVAGDTDVSTGVLGDWFATVLFWKPQVALVVNARTFLPVFVPLAPAGKLLDRVPDEIARILALHGAEPMAIEAEREAMSEVRIAPTNDRRVVGVMNEFAFLGEHWFEGDLTELSLRMAGTPVGPLRSGDSFPARALAALIGEISPGSEGLAKVIAFPGTAAGQSAPPVQIRDGRERATEAAAIANCVDTVFVLKVSLLNTKPPIWRRLLVDGSITLDGLHEVIQAAFGWWNCHLHDFEIGRTRYGVPGPDWDFGPAPLDERTARLDAVVGEGASFHYTYDFGDDWRHKVTVEKVGPVEPGTMVPNCIGGRRACPPEDCGGPWGYQDLLESLAGRPGASDARLDLVGPDFDPAEFAPIGFALEPGQRPEHELRDLSSCGLTIGGDLSRSRGQAWEKLPVAALHRLEFSGRSLNASRPSPAQPARPAPQLVDLHTPPGDNLEINVDCRVDAGRATRRRWVGRAGTGPNARMVSGSRWRWIGVRSRRRRVGTEVGRQQTRHGLLSVVVGLVCQSRSTGMT